ncbi:MAG TPA: histidine kinase [Mobilitalea sp.]|nr:histidine kinase [Mobilitalea sp.]
MYEIIDKLLLYICCLVLYLFQMDISYAVIPAILALALACLSYYFENKRVCMVINLSYSLLCIFVPEYIIFIPLIQYNILHTEHQYLAVVTPLLFVVNSENYNFSILIFTSICFFVSYLFKSKSDKLNSLQFEYNDLRDTSSSFSQVLEEKNRSILKNKDYEINLATLNERNRISKELHDNIGHLLSRSLLQVGALLTITKDEDARESLSALKDSLSAGMDDIRITIHKMYDDSIDLYSQVEQLVKTFTFCPITYEYGITTPPPIALKHSILAIIKESLANIIRHSDATKVSILLREHPAMYQLIINDNGKLATQMKEKIQQSLENQVEMEGMGLQNIIDRVKGYGGNINITMDNGFKLFITIPKKINDGGIGYNDNTIS